MDSQVLGFSRMKNILLLSLTLTLASCSTQSKHVNPATTEPHALIKGQNVGLNVFTGKQTHTAITEVDGKNTQTFWTSNPRVTPGVHEVRVVVGTSILAHHHLFTMNFKAGKTYQVQARGENEKFDVRVVDTATGTVVLQEPLAPVETTFNPVTIPVYVH